MLPMLPTSTHVKGPASAGAVSSQAEQGKHKLQDPSNIMAQSVPPLNARQHPKPMNHTAELTLAPAAMELLISAWQQ